MIHTLFINIILWLITLNTIFSRLPNIGYTCIVTISICKSSMINPTPIFIRIAFHKLSEMSYIWGFIASSAKQSYIWFWKFRTFLLYYRGRLHLNKFQPWLFKVRLYLFWIWFLANIKTIFRIIAISIELARWLQVICIITIFNVTAITIIINIMSNRRSHLVRER